MAIHVLNIYMVWSFLDYHAVVEEKYILLLISHLTMNSERSLVFLVSNRHAPPE